MLFFEKKKLIVILVATSIKLKEFINEKHVIS